MPEGRPIVFFMSAGLVSNYTRAAALLGGLPTSGCLLAGRCYDADRFRGSLKDKGIAVCIRNRKFHKKTVSHNKRHNRIDIISGRFKDWRLLATRYDQCPEPFFFAIMLAATARFRA